MAALQFPSALFQTQRRMDDYSASDMRYGDLSEAQLKSHILKEKTDNSSRRRLQKILLLNIDWQKKIYPETEKGKLNKAISRGRSPKFDRFQDNFNGMGGSVHDTWATPITLKSLHIENDWYQAIVHYKVQDHFGLDSEDILKEKFSQFHFFRIWFVLQRYNHFAFRPYITNMAATIEITGAVVKDNLKIILLILVIASGTLVGYFFWWWLQPVKIIAVHQNNNYSDILVENFPVTDNGKINWWLQNKIKLKA